MMVMELAALAHQSVGDCLVVLVMELAALAHQSMAHQSIDGPRDHITHEKKKREGFVVMVMELAALAHQSVGDCLVVLVMELAALAHQSMAHHREITSQTYPRDTSSGCTTRSASSPPSPLSERDPAPTGRPARPGAGRDNDNDNDNDERRRRTRRHRPRREKHAPSLLVQRIALGSQDEHLSAEARHGLR